MGADLLLIDGIPLDGRAAEVTIPSPQHTLRSFQCVTPLSYDRTCLKTMPGRTAKFSWCFFRIVFLGGCSTKFWKALGLPDCTIFRTLGGTGALVVTGLGGRGVVH